MQPQMNPSSYPGPEGVPGGGQTAPGERRPRSHAWVALLVIASIGVLGWLGWRNFGPAAQTGAGAGAAVPTATVFAGRIERTIRLTGTTTAEKYASLVAPRLRGGRGGGVSVSVSRGAGGMAVTIDVGGGMGGGGGRQGGGGGSSSGGSGSAASASTPAASASSGGASSGGVSASGTSGFRGATNRFGSSSASSSVSAASSAAQSAASSAPTASSSSSGGGGGGGDRLSGGMSDFMQVIQTMARPGSAVKKGDIVAEFDIQYQIQRLDDYKATVEQAERTLNSLDAQIDVTRKSYRQTLDQAKAAVEKAKLDIKTTPVRSVIDAEILRLSLEQAQANLKQVEAALPHQEISLKSQRRDSELDLQQSKIELERAQRNVERMLIRAPIDGMFVAETTLRGSEFAQIQQGDQVFPGQMFGRVVDPNSMLVAAVVNQSDVEHVRIGARAVLRFDAFPGLELPAHVTSIGAMTKPGGPRAAYVKEIPVILKIDRLDPRIIPDLTASADVILAETDGVLVVPVESVFRDAQGAPPYVFVRTANGFEKRAVEVRIANFVQAGIVSGLRKGDVVALSRPYAPAGKPAGLAGSSEAAARLISLPRMLFPLPARQSRSGVPHVV